jgi:hydroxymethylbilane synthase
VLDAARRRIDDVDARSTATAERVCLRALGGGCARPIGAYAKVERGRLTLTAVVGALDGSRVVRAELAGGSAEELGRAVAAELLGLGARELLA